MKLRSVRGTHDIFGEEIDKFNFISNIVSKNANLKEYKEIQTPIFEFSDLFAKPLGEHSDVVLKEMYSFEDRNNEFLTLRPEYTTPMIRAAALIIGVVYSGRNVKNSLFLSSNEYISFNTTSECSPRGFANKSLNSKIGVWISLYSFKLAFLETILEIKLNLSISSPNISCVPLTDLNFILITKFYFFSFFSN